MMLATSVLSAAMNTVASVFSPSSNACVKRVAPTRFRYDPYCQSSTYPVIYTASSSPITASHHTCSVGLNNNLPSPTVQAYLPTTSSQPLSASHPIVCPLPCSSTAAPTTAAPKSVATRYAIIKFKQETFTFIAPFRIAVHDVVVVEGDRGEAIGVVQDITTVKPATITGNITANVLRKASEKDLATLATQREKEAAALKMTQAMATAIGLHATIEDVEYQFDMNKLSIFVRRSAKGGFVDFRKLQRGLFREFRCRIWCNYMDEVEAIEQAPRSR